MTNPASASGFRLSPAGRRVAAALMVAAAVMGACSVSSEPELTAVGDEPAVTVEAAESAEPTAVSPTMTPEPPATATPEPTAAPEPTATPQPIATSTPEPTLTPEPTATPDTSPIVIDAGEWTITQAEVDGYIDFIEETHQLEFKGPVRVVVSEDIGFEFAPQFEIFNEDHWYLLRGLGLADSQADRDSANQVRRDRIRGVCCQFLDMTQVAVEIQPTELGTATIVVHELVHALHTQYPEVYRRTRIDTDEAPVPYAAAVEGIPQFIAFEYLALGSEEERAEVIPDLPIIRDDMIPLLGRGPARYLNFAYANGPAFVDVVVDANGLDGLADLLNNPPTTTAQVLFPEKYLAGQSAVEVPEPQAPAGITVRAGAPSARRC